MSPCSTLPAAEQIFREQMLDLTRDHLTTLRNLQRELSFDTAACIDETIAFTRLLIVIEHLPNAWQYARLLFECVRPVHRPDNYATNRYRRVTNALEYFETIGAGVPAVAGASFAPASEMAA